MVINLTKGKQTLVDEKDYEWLSQWKWYFDGKYARRSKDNVRMHKLLLPSSSLQVDHINRNRLDNRRKNLRLVTHIENINNRNISIKNKSGYTGVYFNNQKKMWVAEKTRNYKKHFLGYFPTKELASIAVNLFQTHPPGSRWQ